MSVESVVISFYYLVQLGDTFTFHLTLIDSCLMFHSFVKSIEFVNVSNY